MLTWVEIDSGAIKHNLKQIRKLAGPNISLMPVIKANAYGHGFLGIAKISDQNKDVNKICVVNSAEAVELIKNKIKKQILILSFINSEEKEIALAIKSNVIFPLYSQDIAKLLNKVGERLGKKANVHLKIDTGATRVGILPTEIPIFIKQIKKYKYLNICGAYSHFSSSEEDPIFTKKQHDSFQSACNEISKQGIDIKTKHIACSAAIAQYPYSRENAIRLGLSLYGLYPDKKTKNKIDLKPALSWFTKIIQVKNVPSGTKIGYGGTYEAKIPTKIAVIPVGYWDGFDRKLSNRGYVLIKGKKCPIAGRICMNLSMVDITGLDVKEGDKVTLLGKDGEERINAEQLADWCGTINYEIITRINSQLPRFYR